jgi:hypothetical protein
MLDENIHPSDEELLLCADGELSRRRAAQIRDHLKACWDCRTRMVEFERAITDFVKAHHRTFDAQLPPAAGARARLKERMANEPPNQRNGRRLQLTLNLRRFAYSSVLVLLIFLGMRALHSHTVMRESSGRADAMLLPDKNLTPGVTNPVSINDICSMDHDQVVRRVSEALQQQVFREYGLRGARVENYEVDYLISPGLGGADDIRNLWPEPRYNTTWNSFVKDQLEDYLHRSVCAGKLDLATAQKDLSTDWISAYKKYFRTKAPLERLRLQFNAKDSRQHRTDVKTSSAFAG